jgi:hypothetical protein
MANVESDADEPVDAGASAMDTPVIRLTGLALMANINIRKG